jgi:GAF domain-containing protein
MLEQALQVPLNPDTLVGRAVYSGQPRIALDVGPGAVRFENPLLPWTRSRVMLPLLAGRRVIGVLDVQSTEEAAFDEQDAAVLQIMADQLAVTIENARLFEETWQTMRELEAASRQYTEESWRVVAHRTGQARGYRYREQTVELVGERSPEVRQAWLQGRPIITSSPRDGGQDAISTLAVPIRLREQTVGVLNLSFEDQSPSADTVSMIQEIANRLALALENARLLDETRQRAERDRLTADVTAQVRAYIDLKNILQTAVREVGRALGSDRAFIQLGVGAQPAEE